MLTDRIYEDLRSAIRLIARNRTLSFAVFVSLALGIGASTSAFAVFNYLLFQRLPIPETDRVVRITSTNPASPLDQVSYPDFDDLRKRATVFDAVATSEADGFTVDAHGGGQPRMTIGMITSGDFFKVMRLQPVLGRAFGPDEDAVPDRSAVAVISSDLWQREFEGKSDVLGKTLRVNSTEFTIVAVMPKDFRGMNLGGVTLRSDFYVPRMMMSALSDPSVHPLTERNNRNADVYGRLKAGVSIEQARIELASIGAQLEKENPVTNRAESMTAYTQLGFLRAQRPVMEVGAFVFLFIGCLVLAIGCVNAATLMLSTVPVRARESAVRLALGAPATRLTTQFVIESCIVSACATAAGLGIARVFTQWLRAIQVGSGMFPISIDVHVSGSVGLFAAGVGIGSGIISAIVPAIRCSLGDLNQWMKSADPRVQTARMPFRRILLGAQVAVATMVLVLSGLELQSLSLVQMTDPGFRVNKLLTMAFSPVQSRGMTVAQAQQFYHELLERVRSVPGVESAALGHHVPLGIASHSSDVVIDGYAMPEGKRSLSVATGLVGDGYFQTMGIPLIRGRAFEAHDNGAAPKVVIINQAMADKYWPGADAIGKHIQVQGPNAGSAEVVGIARTAKYRNIVEEPLPFMYTPLDQTGETFMYLFVATQRDPASFVSAVRNAAREIDPDHPIYDIHTMEDIVRRQAVFEFRMMAEVASSAAAVSLLLALFGLYATIGYSVSQRRREIGIRMAIGATNRRIFRMVVLDGLKVSIPGIAIGAVAMMLGASGVAQAPANPRDPSVYVTAAAVLVGITLVSSYYPARRAARIDPNECLRSE